MSPHTARAPGRQAAKSRATRDRVVNALVSIISEEGFGAASSTRIAGRAGVTWGAVQHHFGSKEAILQEVLERSHALFTHSMEPAGEIAGGADERIEHYVRTAWTHYRGEVYAAAMEILLAGRGRGSAVEEGMRQRSRADHLALARRIFHDSAASDAVIQEAVYCVHCHLNGLLLETRLEPADFDPEPCLTHLQSLLRLMLYP